MLEPFTRIDGLTTFDRSNQTKSEPIHFSEPDRRVNATELVACPLRQEAVMSFSPSDRGRVRQAGVWDGWGDCRRSAPAAARHVTQPLRFFASHNPASNYSKRMCFLEDFSMNFIESVYRM